MGFWDIVARVGGSIAILTLLFTGARWMYRGWWPGRERWRATSSYDDRVISPQQNPQVALSRDKEQVWRSPLPQETGAWFKVDMGDERMIASIHFEVDDDAWLEKEQPTRWQIRFCRRDTGVLGSKSGEGLISAEDKDLPNKIQSFEVHISEVAEDMPEGTIYAEQHGTKVFWAISFIRIKEYRFSIFGKRFWKHEI